MIISDRRVWNFGLQTIGVKTKTHESSNNSCNS